MKVNAASEPPRRSPLRAAIPILLAVILSALSSGCVAVPAPRFTARTESIKGRIVDARTQRPIAGAAIQAYSPYSAPVGPVDRPRALSDAQGFFNFPRTENFQMFYILMGPCGAGLRDQSSTQYKNYLVSKNGYVPVEFVAAEMPVAELRKGYKLYDAGNILLSPGAATDPTRLSIEKSRRVYYK